MPKTRNLNNPNFPGIYSITHVESGRRYVGSSKNIHLRWRAHRKSLKGNLRTSPYLQHVWNKYGPDAFRWDILEVCPNDETVLVTREQHWIDQFKDVLLNSRKFAMPSCREWMESPDGQEFRDEVGKRSSDWWEIQPYIEKTCKFCGKTFTTRNIHKPTIFCSKNCTQKNRVAIGKEHEERHCVMCGKPFRTRKTHGIVRCPECKYKAKRSIKLEDVPSILRRIANNESMDRIGRDFNVSGGVIQSIGKRKRYTEVLIDQDTENALRIRFSGKRQYPEIKITLDQVREIKRRLKHKVHQTALAQEFGVSPQMICNIKKGRQYADIEPAPDPSPLLPGFD